jgi:bleomycin hydrolase
VDIDTVLVDATEGGYQSWAIDLVKKRGIVPKTKMGTTSDGANSALALAQLHRLLATAVRDCDRVGEGRNAKAQRKSIARNYRKKVDQLLNTTIGRPPKRFSVGGKQYSPKTYVKALGLKDKDLDYVTLTHDPSRGWYRGYEHAVCTGMKACVAYNVPMSVIQSAAKKTIKSGEAVYFSVNHDKDENPHWVSGKNIPKAARGVLSVSAFNYKPYIPAQKLSKRDLVSAGISTANHAMAITAYDPGDKRGSVRKWKVENSHGSKTGDRGYYHMYDDFFRRYAEEVVVPRSVLTKAVLKRIAAHPVETE